MSSYPVVPRWASLRRALSFVQNPIPSLHEFQQEYGPTYSMYMGGLTKGLLTVEPEIIQLVLQRQHRFFDKSKLQTEKMGYFLGKGLLTNTGEDWLRQRRLIQPGFHKERLANVIFLMQEVIQDMIAEIEKDSRQGTIMVYNKMLRLSFRIIAKTLFSENIRDDELNELSSRVSEVQEFIIKYVRLPFLIPWFRLSGQRRRKKKLVNEIRAQLTKYIHSRKTNGGSTSDLLDMLLEARYEETGLPMSQKQLLDEILILFAAGHETTANALSWIFYLLSHHSEAVSRIRQEASEFLAKEPSLSNLKSLAYTTRVIQESMRLFPPAWITDRVALQDVDLGGHRVRKGEMVIIYIYGAHHNPKYWPDPERFDPDRFLPEHIRQRPAFSYLPFGGGPRLCIGNSFSMMEMQLAVAQLALHFDFELVSDEPVELLPLITLRPKTRIEMRWKKRV